MDESDNNVDAEKNPSYSMAVPMVLQEVHVVDGDVDDAHVPVEQDVEWLLPSSLVTCDRYTFFYMAGISFAHLRVCM